MIKRTSHAPPVPVLVHVILDTQTDNTLRASGPVGWYSALRRCAVEVGPCRAEDEFGRIIARATDDGTVYVPSTGEVVGFEDGSVAPIEALRRIDTSEQLKIAA